ncbi:cytochrome P450 [Mycena filopes]|nr:cytochrome P450 [Mycena filopes]
MLVLLIKSIASATLASIVYQILRIFLKKSPLNTVPGPPRRSFWTGNFLALFSANGWAFHDEIAEKYGGAVRIDGPFGSKILYVFDPLALYHIAEQPLYDRNHTDLMVSNIMFGEGLLSTASGEKHRKQRKTLNPVFNVAHLRGLTPVFYTVARKLRTALKSKAVAGPVEVDILHWLTRTATELIGQGGLGYSFDALTDNPEDPVHPYSEALRGMQPLLIRLSLGFKFILPFVYNIGTPWLQRAAVGLVPWKAVHDFRDVVDVMHRTTREIYEEKRGNLGGAKDIMSILMRENSRVLKEDSLSEAEILGQVRTLIFAATETTSTALARILHVLAQDPDAQERLRAELTAAQQGGDDELSYDTLMQLPYLDAVCRETLRLYPPALITMRTALEDTVLPLATPIGSDGNIRAVPVPRGTQLMLSIHAANRSPHVWGADAAEWRPARWMAPLPQNVVDAHAGAVYQNSMTFASGPRACIGFKFALLEIKVVLAVLLPAFRVSLPEAAVVWNFGFIARPTVKSGEEPCLPLVLMLQE